MRTTEEIVAGLSRGDRHSVENTRPLDLPDRDLPVPPYSYETDDIIVVGVDQENA